MPTYEYKCQECGVVFERFQRFSEEPVSKCPECNGSVRRVIHPVGIIFTGSGFYVTDNRGASTVAKPEAKSKDEAKGDPKSPDTTAKTEFKATK